MLTSMSMNCINTGIEQRENIERMLLAEYYAINLVFYKNDAISFVWEKYHCILWIY